eukprot:8172808-Karenia_brevis.AAC.1
MKTLLCAWPTARRMQHVCKPCFCCGTRGGDNMRHLLGCSKFWLEVVSSFVAGVGLDEAVGVGFGAKLASKGDAD